MQAPAAREVRLASGPMQAALGGKPAPPFQRDAAGLWTLTIGPLPPNLYVYRLQIDGVAAPDPNHTIAGTAAQPPYSQLVVHGESPAYYDARPVPHGAVTRHIYPSDVLSGEREIYVYPPPGFDRKKKYPVLYLLGGSGELVKHNIRHKYYAGGGGGAHDGAAWRHLLYARLLPGQWRRR